jgi:hypothetical protein
MNKLILICALFFAGIANLHSQEPSIILTINPDKTYSYEKVFDAPGKTKEQIFDAMKAWVIKNIKPNQIQTYFDDSNKNIITSNPSFNCSVSSIIDFKLNIEIKEGKYKLSANAFTWHNFAGISKNFGDYSQLAVAKKDQVKIMADVDKGFEAIVNSLQKSLNSNSDW